MEIRYPRCSTRGNIIPMYYTGEHHPTVIPQRYYACVNKHLVLVYDQEPEDVDWGDQSTSNEFRAALNRKGGMDEYELIGKLHWKS